MKDENLSQKEKNENNQQENINKTTYSPKQEKKEQKDTYVNLLLSPERNEMNQKFFPSKENYFGIKTSPNNMTRAISPGAHSPILNYYAGISPHGDSLGFYSPKNDYENNNSNTNTFSGKLSPNFNYSPSHIFNIQHSNKDIRSNLQNFKLQNNFNNNEDDSKTLQEKMAPFVGKTDINNFIKIGSFPSSMNSLEENKNDRPEEDDEDDENEEAFTLKIDDFVEDFASETNKQKSIIQSHESFQKKLLQI